MSYETIISIIVLALSTFGLATMVLRKIPILTGLPEISEGRLRESSWQKLGDKIKNSNPVKSFSFEVFLQKVLSRVRILTMKIESKTGSWLQVLRQKASQKNLGQDDYWQKLKKSTKERKKRMPE
jgi:chromatin remodeling complex protein RSC6